MLTGLKQSLAKLATGALGMDTFAQVMFPNFLASTGPRMGATNVLRAYNEMPWLRAIFSKIQQDVASLTWVIDVPTKKRGEKWVGRTSLGSPSPYYRNRTLQRAHGEQRRTLMLKARAQGELSRIDDHALLDFLSAGNAWFNGLIGLGLTQLHLDLVGEMAWFIETNGVGMPVSYVPFPPTWIIQKASPSWPYYRVMGPWKTVDVPADQILFAYHPDPSNPFLRGTGFGQVMGDDLETDAYAAKFTKDWFKYKAIPPILISGLGVDLSEMERVESRWLQKTQGRGRGWLPHFMSKDVKVHQLTQTFAEQELGPLRKFERDLFRNIIGMPPEILGITENSNKATAVVAEQIYGKRLILPRAEFLRAVLQEHIANRFDERIILDYISPVTVDKEFQLDVMKAQPHAFMQDEWRAMADHDALTDGHGQVHMLEFKWRPVSVLGGQSAPSAVEELTTPDPAPLEVDDDELDEPVLDDEDFDEKGALRSVTESRYGAAAFTVKGFGPDNIASVLMSVDAKVLIRHGKVVLQDVVEHFGSELLTSLDLETSLSFDVDSPEVQAFLRKWGGERMTGMVNATTRKAIGKQLAAGLKNGETTKQLRRRIMKVFKLADEARANTIARTEVGRASNFGTWSGLKQASIEAKGWLSTEDALVRDTHAALNGTIVPVDEPFISNSGAIGMFPGDMGMASEDCNCRCGLLPEVLTSKGYTWKSLESARAPYDGLMRRAMRSGFAEQRKACLAAFDAASA